MAGADFYAEPWPDAERPTEWRVGIEWGDTPPTREFLHRALSYEEAMAYLRERRGAFVANRERLASFRSASEMRKRGLLIMQAQDRIEMRIEGMYMRAMARIRSDLRLARVRLDARRALNGLAWPGVLRGALSVRARKAIRLVEAAGDDPRDWTAADFRTLPGVGSATAAELLRWARA